LEVRNIADLAAIIIESAMARKETRACHIREDFPKTDDNNYKGITLVENNSKPKILKK
jgi:succinate dehydrogenase/fumarate reductase flavoprotein subunit